MAEIHPAPQVVAVLERLHGHDVAELAAGILQKVSTDKPVGKGGFCLRDLGKADSGHGSGRF